MYMYTCIIFKQHTIIDWTISNVPKVVFYLMMDIWVCRTPLFCLFRLLCPGSALGQEMKFFFVVEYHVCFSHQ